LFTAILIENQVREANAQQVTAKALSMDIELAMSHQVTIAYLDNLTFIQSIKLAKEGSKPHRKRFN
jgi:hypothetical protein